MIDRTVIARLLFTAPRVVDRLRARTFAERQKPQPDVVTISLDELEALTTDYELMATALGEYRQRLLDMRLRGAAR